MMQEKIAERTFEFGKIDFYGTGRKINAVTVEVTLYQKDEGLVFTASGEVWNNIHTDIVCGGQCLEELREFLYGNNLFMDIYYLWKNYHLNDMHAGTREQEAFLDGYLSGAKKQRYEVDYTERCNILKAHNMYTVAHPVTGQPYSYGHDWIFYEIPKKDIDRILDIMKMEVI